MMVKTLDWTLLYDQNHEPYLLFDRKLDPEEACNLVDKKTDIVSTLAEIESVDWGRRPQQ